MDKDLLRYLRVRSGDGDAEATYKLGYFLANGMGVQENPAGRGGGSI